MSTPFKMKGWRGSQKTSPIRQPKNIFTTLANLQKHLGSKNIFTNLQKNISNTVEGIGTNIRKGIKPQSKMSGFGLTDLEKAQAKKLGISEYQYKTGAGISSSTRHKKRMFEKKHGLGKYADKPFTTPDEKNVIDMQGSTAETYTGGFGTGDKWKDIIEGGSPQQEVSDDATPPAEVDYGTGATTKDWKQESSTGWSLHELTQERKNLEVGSAEYKKIQNAINAAYKEGPPVEEEQKKEPKPRPKRKKSSIYTPGYIRDYTGEDIRGKKYN